MHPVLRYVIGLLVIIGVLTLFFRALNGAPAGLILVASFGGVVAAGWVIVKLISLFRRGP